MDEKLLARYFEGQCSAEEVAQVLAWFAAQEPDAEREQQLYRFWQSLDGPALVPPGRILAGIQAAIGQPPGQALSADVAAGGHPGRWRWLLQAAAIFLPLACLGLWLLLSRSPEPVATRLLRVEAPAGTRKTIRLGDGSSIYLNSGSRIVFPEYFSDRSRQVTLSGEAFFEVAKDASRPFTVRAGPLLIRVLGTSFHIKHRPHENHIDVALASGSVRIGQPGRAGAGSQLAQLQPGQQLVYQPASQHYQVSSFDPAQVWGWRQGILHFKQASFDQVVAQLSTWYGVHIELAGTRPPQDKAWRYTGSYHRQSLDHVLEGIAFVKGFTYQRTGNKVTIRFK